MDPEIMQTLTNRLQHLKLLEYELSECGKQQTLLDDEMDTFNQTIEAVEALNEQSEQNAMLKIGKRVYVEGKVKHTGEYLVQSSIQSGQYHMLFTIAQTIEYLMRKLQQLKEARELLDNNELQIINRIEHFQGNEADALPSIVESDKGIALRVGEFYEILEKEEG